VGYAVGTVFGGDSRGEGDGEGEGVAEAGVAEGGGDDVWAVTGSGRSAIRRASGRRRGGEECRMGRVLSAIRWLQEGCLESVL